MAELLSRRALRVHQVERIPLYVFALQADEILRVADISRVGRSDEGELIGYQRPEVKAHIHDIVEYLQGDEPLFPNSVILALSGEVRFKSSRGPATTDGLATAGTLELPMPDEGERKPAWIVDGQQRSYALDKSDRGDFPVIVTAFVADTIDLQRDQFVRINNARPLPTGLVTELLPEVSAPISRRLATKRLPSAFVDLLAQQDDSPFQGLIKRPSMSKTVKRSAPVTDTGLVKAIEDSLQHASGCLFPHRNVATGETDTDTIYRILVSYWSAVRNTFPDAWGLPPTRSRLMHGVGIRSMGRVMDRLMARMDPWDDELEAKLEKRLAVLRDVCAWTAGVWDEPINMAWNDLQNTGRHINILSNFLIRKIIDGDG